jgi:O-antigen/teichoic acid export membrane protein
MSFRTIAPSLAGAAGVSALSRLQSGDVARALRGAGLVVAIRFAGAGLAYLSQIALARWMGGFQYGIYAYAWSWVMLLGFVAPLGLNVLLLRTLPDALVRRRLGRLAGQLRWVPAMTFIAGAALAAVLAGLVVWSGDLIGRHYVSSLVLAALCLPFFALSVTGESIGRAFGWPLVAYAPAYVVRPVLFFLLAGAAVALGGGLDAPFAMGLMLVACIATTAGQGVAILARLRANLRHVAPRRHPAAWFAAALPLLAIEVCYLVITGADVLILGYLGAPEEVGQYFAAARTCAFLGYISFGITGLAIPKFSEFNSRGDREGLARFVRGIVRWGFFPTAAGAAVLALGGEAILSLFGGEFTAAYPVLLVMLAGVLARAATGPVEYLLAMNGHQRAVIVILGVSAGLDVALNLLLIPAFGMMGAAVATSSSIALSVAAAAVVARLRLGVRAFVV